MKTKVFSLVIIILLLSAGWSISYAQVTTNITSSGLGTTITPSGNTYTITGGTRPGGGPNLFHSFGNFSVGAPDTANFFNDSGLATTNILSRVTGGNPSNIFGTIQTTGFGSANLFLINPAGVIFGSTASLNVGGSFHVSTADYLRMSDGSLFIANPAYENSVNSNGTVNTTVLSSAAPVAFGFLNSNPAAITVDGAFLSVPQGQTISLVGGNRTFTRGDTGDTVPPGVTITGGYLQAPSGQINLVSVASPGEVLFPTMQYGPNVNGVSFTTMGDINLTTGAFLDVSGDGGGTVLIRGGRLVMDNSIIFTDTLADTDGKPTAVDINVTGDITLSNLSFISASAAAGGRSGDIVITGGSLTLSDLSSIFAFGGNKDVGNISVNVGTLNLTSASSIQSAAGATGGGNITVTADTVTIQDGGLLQTQTFTAGHGGDITLNLGAGSLNLNNGQILTLASDQGQAGNITINAGTVSLFGADSFSSSSIVSQATGQGPTGDITLNVGTLQLQGVAGIQTESFGDGIAGSIRITASQDVMISTFGITSIGNSNFGNATGITGSIEITAPSLTMSGSGSQINTINTSPARAGDVILEVGNLSITGGSTVRTNTGGSGRGGDILVLGNSVFVSGTGSGLFSESNPSTTGRAGDIQIQANQVHLNNGATISAKSLGMGDAGNITITAGDSVLMQNSTITTQTVQSDGGNITLQVGRLVQLTGSTITTSVQGGLGNGGNITIDPQFVILQNSQILANAFGGNGGNILIVAGMLFIDPLSVINASSTLGVSGTIDIQAPINNLSGTLAPLSEEFLQAAGLLRASCAARFHGGNVSSFVVAGRDGMPLEPGGLLPSPLFIENSGSSRLAGSLKVPDLRVGRSFGEQDLTLAALSAGCAA